MKNKKQKKAREIKFVLRIVLAILIMAVLVFGIFALIHFFTKNNDGRTKLASEINTTEYSNLEDSGQGDSKGADDPKERMEQDEEKRSETKTDEKGLKIAEVSLYYAEINNNGKVEVMGEVSNLVESEGKCIYIFTNGGKNIEVESEIIQNAANTICKRTEIEKSRFTNGTWQVTLKFEGAEAEGVSSPLSLQIN